MGNPLSPPFNISSFIWTHQAFMQTEFLKFSFIIHEEIEKSDCAVWFLYRGCEVTAASLEKLCSQK